MKPAQRPACFMARIGDQLTPAIIPIASGARERLLRISAAAYAVGGE